jgi:hypothetical protein
VTGFAVRRRSRFRSASRPSADDTRARLGVAGAEAGEVWRHPAAGARHALPPISRAVPKELIPVVDTPVIEIVVTEMTESGSSVSSCRRTGKEWIEAYFKPNPRIEARLAADMRTEDLELLKRAERPRQVKSVLQAEPKGNGDAVSRHAGSSAISPSPCSGVTTSCSASSRRSCS